MIANFLPRMMNPSRRSSILAIKVKSLAESGENLAIKTARPVMPPNVKLLANLKK